MKKILIALPITLTLFLLPTASLTILFSDAFGCSSFLDCLGGIANPAPNYPSHEGFIGKLVSDFLPAILGLLGFLTIIMIFISGIQFITSSGNPEGAAAARGRLTYALVGFILVVLAFSILQIVNSVFLGPTGVV